MRQKQHALQHATAAGAARRDICLVWVASLAYSGFRPVRATPRCTAAPQMRAAPSPAWRVGVVPRESHSPAGVPMPEPEGPSEVEHTQALPQSPTRSSRPAQQQAPRVLPSKRSGFGAPTHCGAEVDSRDLLLACCTSLDRRGQGPLEGGWSRGAIEARAPSLVCRQKRGVTRLTAAAGGR